MPDFDNNQILIHLKELQAQLDSVNQKFKQIELELRNSGQSLEQLYLSHKNRLDLADQKRVNENLSHQLANMQHEFSNIQSGISWFAMEMAVFMATLERAAFFAAAEHQALEERKRREEDLEEETKYDHLKKDRELAQQQEQLNQMAEKARTYPYYTPSPFQLTPFKTWPY